MQMKIFMVMTLLSALVTAGYGLDIQLSDGTILQKAKVTNVSSRGIEVMHKYGGKKILPEMIAESDHPKLKVHIARYKQLIGNKKITNAIQEARRSGSINAAIPILEQAIKSAPEAENIAEAKQFLTSLKEKSESNIKAVLIAVANEKELSAAIEIMEKAIAENPFAENLEQAKDKLAELKKKRVDFEDHRIETAIQKAETAAYGFDRKIAILREAIARNKNASKLPEAKNLLDKFTELRRQEQRRLAEAIRKTEEKRRAEARRKAEERQRRFAEERRREEEKRRAEARRKAEEERLVAEKRRAETERLAEMQREAEAQRQRVAEEKAKDEQSFLSKIQRRFAESRRKAEEKRVAEAKRKAEEKRVAEAKRLAEMQREAEAQRQRVAEEKAKDEQSFLSKIQRRFAESRRKAEEKRVAEEKAKDEQSFLSPQSVAVEKNNVPFLLNPAQYFPLKWNYSVQDCQKVISSFAMSNGQSDLYEGFYGGEKFYFKFNTFGELIGVVCPTNLIKLMQIVQLANQRFGKVGKFEERMQLQWPHKRSHSVFVAQTSQYIDGLSHSVEVWADELYPHILQNRLDACVAEAQNERTYEKAIRILELGIATNDKAPNLSKAKDYLNSLKRKLAAELAAKERQRARQEQLLRQQRANQQRRQNAVSCGWGCNGTGRLPSGMRCPEHSGPLQGRIAEGVNQDTTLYCLRCGGSGQITQVIMPSEGALISAAFNGQQATAKQIRRTCPTCGGSGKRY